MRRMLLILMIVIISLSLYADVPEYDIGGGQTLLVKEDGTYEIVQGEIEAEKFVGKQYKIDWDKSLDDQFISLLKMADTTGMLATLGDAALKELLLSRATEASIVFLSTDKVLLIEEGEAPVEATYRITPAKDLYITRDGYAEEYLGTFSDDYSEICNTDNDYLLTVHMVRQD